MLSKELGNSSNNRNFSKLSRREVYGLYAALKVKHLIDVLTVKVPLQSCPTDLAHFRDTNSLAALETPPLPLGVSSVIFTGIHHNPGRPFDLAASCEFVKLLRSSYYPQPYDFFVYGSLPHSISDDRTSENPLCYHLGPFTLNFGEPLLRHPSFLGNLQKRQISILYDSWLALQELANSEELRRFVVDEVKSKTIDSIRQKRVEIKEDKLFSLIQRFLETVLFNYQLSMEILRELSESGIKIVDPPPGLENNPIATYDEALRVLLGNFSRDESRIVTSGLDPTVSFLPGKDLLFLLYTQGAELGCLHLGNEHGYFWRDNMSRYRSLLTRSTLNTMGLLEGVGNTHKSNSREEFRYLLCPYERSDCYLAPVVPSANHLELSKTRKAEFASMVPLWFEILFSGTPSWEINWISRTHFRGSPGSVTKISQYETPFLWHRYSHLCKILEEILREKLTDSETPELPPKFLSKLYELSKTDVNAFINFWVKALVD